MIVRPRIAEHARLPPLLSTIDGRTIDLKKLARDFILIVIILKAPWCPVCPTLLSLLSFLGFTADEDDPQEWSDPFTSEVRTVTREHRKFNHILLAYDARFIVMCPGQAGALLEIAHRTGWDRVPEVSFVADAELQLVEQLGLRTVAGAWPSTVRVLPDLSARTIEIGRSAGYYGDHTLLLRLATTRRTEESNAVSALKQSQTLSARLQAECAASTHYDYPAKDKLPLELLTTITSQIAATEISHFRSGNDSPVHSTLGEAAKTCKSWRYVSLVTGSHNLQEQIKKVEKLLAKCPKTGRILTCTDEDWGYGYPAGAQVPPVSIVTLEREVCELARIKTWIYDVFGSLGAHAAKDATPSVSERIKDIPPSAT
ncbi:hypothetical protein PhCBS80983_g00672 [Powellomyces hirtus]|uniref:Uncharacterized protein n=1 Tax=Powellomyces hirtus TaxID=109895 RepID=A0A507EE66_9FUNG|nr:hypothetical protein PhCBS80983_g00672 [Powellomyces hirtus]